MKHSQPLLTKCLQAALIAAPVLLSAAPSEAAATVKATVTGFTGQFAPGQWNRTPTSPDGSGSSTFTDSDTKLTLVKKAGVDGTVSGFISITPTVVDVLRPAGAGQFIGWKSTGDYTWGIAGNAANTRYSFDAYSTSEGITSKLNTTAPISTTPFSVASSVFDNTNPFSTDGLTFQIARAGTNTATGEGTGVISNFVFEAEYEAVPGPLPLLGAAAAFAWSRRLRKRLNSANTLA